MAKKILEKHVTSQILRRLKQLPESHYKKKSATTNDKNDPDITGCTNGIRVEIEVKRPGKEPRPGQYAKLRKWQSAGAVTGWADSVEMFKEIFVKNAHILRLTEDQQTIVEKW